MVFSALWLIVDRILACRWHYFTCQYIIIALTTFYLKMYLINTFILFFLTQVLARSFTIVIKSSTFEILYCISGSQSVHTCAHTHTHLDTTIHLCLILASLAEIVSILLYNRLLTHLVNFQTHLMGMLYVSFSMVWFQLQNLWVSNTQSTVMASHILMHSCKQSRRLQNIYFNFFFFFLHG